MRHILEPEQRETDEPGVDGEREAPAPDDARHGAAVALRASLEHPVEGTEEPAEPAIEHAGQPVPWRPAGLEQDGAQCGTQRQRVHGGNDRRERDRQRELAIELAREAAQERHRHEHGTQHQTDRDDRTADLFHRLVGRISRREAGLDIPLDVLDDDDGVVHHDADGRRSTPAPPPAE